jgi:hypothetical protein
MKLSNGLQWVVLLFCLFVALPVVAAGARVVELYDGSTITGRIVSLDNGVYTIESNSLGRLRLDAAKIRAIRAPGYGGGERGRTAGGMELGALQNRMVGNPTVMGQIMALQNDPQILELLADPEIVRAVQSGDLDALSRNPKFLELMQNSRVRAIQGEMLGR